jgi:hypothetical protein
MSADTDTAPLEQPQRDNLGRALPGARLAVGNRGGGNSHRIAELNRALLECVTPDMIQALTDKTYQSAMGDDLVAQKDRHWLLNKATGRASQHVTVTNASGPAIQTDITQIVNIIQEETPDPDMRLKIARRILQLGQHHPGGTDGHGDANGIDA